MFNEYIWNNYLNAGGDKIVKMFERNLSGKLINKEYANVIADLHRVYCPCEDIIEYVQAELSDAYSRVHSIDWKDENIGTNKGFVDFISSISEEFITDQEKADNFFFSLGYYSTILALSSPSFYIPYYFKCNFNIIMMIAEEFDIELPPLPVKKDYIGRILYYLDLCHVFHSFAKENNMSPYELFAFLYDFAPKMLGGYKSYIIEDLPEPKSAYFIGAKKNDIFLCENNQEITPWQCNPETRAGDMVVMYMGTPISAVDSIWRSVSVGFNDPFFWYYRCTYIGHPKKISQVTQKEMKSDKILKEMPIVKKNMQGINGVELMPSQYNHILDLAKAPKDVLRLDFESVNSDESLKNEKDVENKLIKPLLLKLGYSETDYTQQFVVRLGHNNTKLIPDFVLLPISKSGHYLAFTVIEAKYHIKNKAEFENYSIQVRSYAKQLSAEYAVLADKNKIIITTLKDDYTKSVLDIKWGDLDNADVFSKLFKLIGKKK